MGFLAEQEKIGHGFNIWLPWAAELTEEKFLKRSDPDNAVEQVWVWCCSQQGLEFCLSTY